MSDYLDTITDQEWEDIYLRLVLYVSGKYRASSTSYTSEDIAMQSISDVVSGKRKYDPSKWSLFGYLAALAESHIHNLRRRDQFVQRQNLYLDRSHEYPEQSDIPNQLLENELVDEVLKQLKDDPLAQAIVRMKVEYPGIRSREIAERLKVSLPQIYKAARRIRREISRSPYSS